MNPEDHPRGLDPQERKEWHILCDRLLDLYHKMPMGDTTRKCFAGHNGKGDWVFFFKGKEKDAIKVREALGEMD